MLISRTYVAAECVDYFIDYFINEIDDDVDVDDTRTEEIEMCYETCDEDYEQRCDDCRDLSNSGKKSRSQSVLCKGRGNVICLPTGVLKMNYGRGFRKGKFSSFSETHKKSVLFSTTVMYFFKIKNVLEKERLLVSFRIFRLTK